MKTEPITAQTGLALPLRDSLGLIYDASGDLVAQSSNVFKARELVRLANTHCELVGSLQAALTALNNADGFPNAGLIEQLQTTLAKSTGQTQI